MLHSSVLHAHNQTGNGGSTTKKQLLLVLTLLIVLLFGSAGFFHLTNKLRAVSENTENAQAQAAHTEQKLSILQSEFHRFRADFKKTVDKLSDTIEIADDVEALAKRLDQVRPTTSDNFLLEILK